MLSLLRAARLFSPEEARGWLTAIRFDQFFPPQKAVTGSLSSWPGWLEHLDCPPIDCRVGAYALPARFAAGAVPGQ